MKVLCSIFLGLVYISGVFAQEIAPGYTLTHWNSEDGLPLNIVYEVIMTADGYLWARTPAGLARFDGHSFELFNEEVVSGFGTLGQRPFARVNKNEFWMDNGLGEFYHFVRYKDGLITPFSVPDSLNRTGFTSRFRRYVLAENGEFYFASSRGVFKLENEKFSKLTLGDIDSEVLGVAQRNGNLLVAAKNGFYEVSEDSINFLEIHNDRLKDFNTDSEGNIWGLHYDKVTRVSEEGTITFNIPEEIVSLDLQLLKILEDPTYPGRIIFYATNRKFALLGEEIQEMPNRSPLGFRLISDGKTKSKGWLRIQEYVFHNGELIAVLDTDLDGKNSCSYNDPNSCWVNSRSGIYKISESSFHTIGQEEGIKNIYPLYEDSRGRIWTSTLHGDIFRIDGENIDYLIEGIGFTRGFSFLEIEPGKIWVGQGNGISEFSENEGVFLPIQTPFSQGASQVRVLHKLNENEILAGSNRGLWLYKRASSEWLKIESTDAKELQISQLLESPTGEIWIGTSNAGLYTLKNRQLHPFQGNEELSGVNIRSLYEDNAGTLWIGITWGGLNRVHFSESGLFEITHFTSEDGLFGSVIHTILEDDFGRFWMSSNQGIFWYNKEQLENFANGIIDYLIPVVYQKEDGLPGDEANGGAKTPGIKTRDGRFWFPMVKGLTTVDPSQIDVSLTSFQTKIEELIVPDSTIFVPVSTIFLPKTQRNLTFNYTAFNYQVKSENIFFSYQLEGHDNEWRLSNESRTASYSNLPPGSYTFKVRAGVGNRWDTENESTLAIIIEPYFYETALFKISAVSLSAFFLVGYLIWGFRRRKLLDEEYEIAVKDREEFKSEREHFMDLVNKYVENEIENPDLVIQDISGKVNLSERNLYRKIKEYTGLTPAMYIREFRLLKAKEIIENQSMRTISEVAYAVGFSYPGYFTKLYTKRFGENPKDGLSS